MAKRSGLYQGVKIYAVPASAGGIQLIDDTMTALGWIGGYENILLMYYFPTRLIQMGTGSLLESCEVVNETPISRTVRLAKPQVALYNIDYSVVNNKLFTYPYMYLAVDSGSEAKTFKWELFNTPITDDARISFYGIISTDPAIVCIPAYYDGINNNITQELIVKGFDQLSANTPAMADAIGLRGVTGQLLEVGLSAGLAFSNPNLAIAGKTNRVSSQNSRSQGSRTTYYDNKSTSMHSYEGYNKGASVYTSDDLLAKERAENDIIMKAGQDLLNIAESFTLSKRARGGSANYDIATGFKEIYCLRMRIRNQFIEKIDKFFTAFGYAVNTIKVPQRMNRAKWSYVKTKGCIVEGELPSSDKVKIEEIFDNGIRFWNVMNGAVVGDYSNPATNTPLGGST